ncbi:MAG: lipopolysaccharide biosynthesis protein [Ignavibacteria bacterium]
MNHDFIKSKIRKIIPRSEEKKLYKNSSFIFGSNLFKSGITFIETIILAKIFSIADFGIYVLIINSIELIYQTLNPNLGVAVIKYTTEFINENKKDELASFIKFCLLIIAAISMFCLLIIIFLDISGFILPNEIRGIRFAFYLFVIFKSTSILDSIFMGIARTLSKFRLLAMIISIAALIELLLIILSYMYDRNLSLSDLFIVLSIAHAIQSILFFIISFRLLRNLTSSIFFAKISLLKDRMKEIFHFIVPNSLSKTIKTFHTRIDIIILSFFAGESAVSIYAIAKKFFLVLALLIDPIDNAIYPQIEQLYYERKYRQLKLLLKSITIKVFLLIIVTFTILIAAYPILIKMILPPEYKDSILPFNIMLIGISINYSFFWLVSMVLTLKLTKERLLIDFITFILSNVIALILVPKLSYIGSSIALSFSYIFSSIAIFILTYNKFFKLNTARG